MATLKVSSVVTSPRIFVHSRRADFLNMRSAEMRGCRLNLQHLEPRCGVCHRQVHGPPEGLLAGVSGWMSKGLLRASPVLRRPQTIKPNPNETVSGKFDRSFEKLASQLESKLPFRQENIIFGNKYDHLFGEEGYEELKQAARDDVHGREKEKPAARKVKSYFTGRDLSISALQAEHAAERAQNPHAERVEETLRRTKVAENRLKKEYDKSILRHSNEATEFYYKVETFEEKRAKRRIATGVCCVAVGVGYVGVRRLFRWMRD